MLKNTTPEKQGMESGNAGMEARPNGDAGVVWPHDETLEEEETTVDEDEEMLAGNSHGDHSTVSTELSHDKRVFSSHPSPILEADAETDPTSIPSGLLDDGDLEGKDTESPMDSIDAVYGSDSYHSTQSESSSGDSDSKESRPTAVNPGKAKAIGYHLSEPSPEFSASKFHDPKNSREALHINDKIKNMNETMDDIDRHPFEHFRNHGSSYQLSAQPEMSAEPDLDVESDVTNQRKVHSAPDHMRQFDLEEGQSVGRSTKRKSPCCTMM